MKRSRANSTDDYSGYLEHPRYGRVPRITGINPSDAKYSEGVFFHWHSREGVRIPNTAIVANIDKQAPATIHVTHYFDSRRVCRKCGAHFIFFAREQQYWYEELGFPLESDLVDCINCRRHEHRLRKSRQEYERLLKKEERSTEDTLSMIENGVYLVEENIFSKKLLSKLRGFIYALKSIPEGKAQEFLSRMATFDDNDS